MPCARDATEQTLAAQGVKELTIDLWVDEAVPATSGRPRDGHVGRHGDRLQTPPPAETADLAVMLEGLTAAR